MLERRAYTCSPERNKRAFKRRAVPRGDTWIAGASELGAGLVERGIGEAVGVLVLFARDVDQFHGGKMGPQGLDLDEAFEESGILDPVLAVELAHQELRVRINLELRAAEFLGELQGVHEGGILRHVVGRRS